VSALLIGYLLGSIPVARLVAGRHGVDLGQVGDRNPGYWNAKEQLGRARSVPVFVGDVAKGAVAAAVGLALVTDDVWGIAYAAVAGAMIGHAWPVFAGWRGGRSVLTFVGGAAVLAPAAALVAIVACVVVTLVTRSFAWGARVGIFGFPLAQLLFETPNRVAATGVLMSIIGLRFALAALADRRLARAADGPPGPAHST
jgi:glycerol-3-phosphate acyltransferase PlsY